MRFLIDNSVSWRLVDSLAAMGHEAIHVRQIGLGDAADADIYARAVREQQIIITQDVDFGTLLAMDKSKSTAVILFRTLSGRPDDQMEILRKHLPAMQKELVPGTVMVIAENGMRIRRWASGPGGNP